MENVSNLYLMNMEEKKDVFFMVKVNAGALKTEVGEVLENGVIKINIKARAEKGRANNDLIKFLAKEFGVNKDRIKIIKGRASKIKLIKIAHSLI